MVGVVLLVVLAAGEPARERKGDETQGRTLSGQVINQGEQPLTGARVYLQNTRTLVVKTYITSQDGSYRFSALSPNVDYQVYAEYKGHKSDTKTLSAFDSRSNVVMYLKIHLQK